MNIPSVDIHMVGAGGGLIASADGAGLLRAGPACYGRGGTRPTVIDALFVLWRLKPGPYAGRVITLSLEKAMEAIETHVAKPLGLGVSAAAAGIIQLVEQNMIAAKE